MQKRGRRYFRALQRLPVYYSCCYERLLIPVRILPPVFVTLLTGDAYRIPLSRLWAIRLNPSSSTPPSSVRSGLTFRFAEELSPFAALYLYAFYAGERIVRSPALLVLLPILYRYTRRTPTTGFLRAFHLNRLRFLGRCLTCRSCSWVLIPPLPQYRLAGRVNRA